MRKHYQKPQTEAIHLDGQIALMGGSDGKSKPTFPETAASTVATAVWRWAKESVWGVWSESEGDRSDW